MATITNSSAASLGTPVRTAPGTRESLREHLDLIAQQGWDGPAGRAVLGYAMTEIVKPVVRWLGLYGAAGEFAESTGWAAAWEALLEPDLAEQPRPWGMVSIRVRRAVLGERMADIYGTDTKSAWRIRRFNRTARPGEPPTRGEWSTVANRGALQPPLRLDQLAAECGRCTEPDPAQTTGPCLDAVIDLLVRHGWPTHTARAAVLHVADRANDHRPDSTAAPGWRDLAARVGIPPWQARRVTVLLLGAPGWPGLAERFVSGGPSALRGPVVAAAVRATRVESLGSPPHAAAITASGSAPVARAS